MWRALSLCLDRNSSLNSDGVVAGGNRVNSDLMTSAAFSGIDAENVSRASLKRTICSWTVGWVEFRP